MSHHYQIDTERRLVNIQYQGAITVDEVMTQIRKVLDDPAYQREMDAIADFSQATLLWTLAELDRFRVFVSKIKYITGPSRWAAVFPKGKDTSTARMFIALHNAFEGTIKVKLFDCEADALKWVTEDTVNKDPK
ncbi:MAG: hypothetical protein IPH75_10390 [bacterium]|nr:hypothetical protein [bacterium]